MTDNPAVLSGSGTTLYGIRGGYDFPTQNSSMGVELLFNYGNASFSSIDEAVEGLATSMTNHIRQSGVSQNTTTATGTIFRIRTIVVIEWYWAIFPAAILFCSAVFLATVMINDSLSTTETWKWKADPLALIALGLNSRTMESTGALASEKTINKAAKQLKVRLCKTDERWGFVEVAAGQQMD